MKETETRPKDASVTKYGQWDRNQNGMRNIKRENFEAGKRWFHITTECKECYNETV